MKYLKSTKNVVGYPLLILLVIGVILNQASSQETNTSKVKFSKYVDKKGNISLPPNFRMKMVHLGSWLVPQGEASGFHDVYTEVASAQAYQQTGKFPDGATIVKELRPSFTGNYTTGANVKSATAEVKQWFVMIKNTQNRFKDHPNWGEGWGWALIKPNNPLKNISKNYKVDCIGCHIPAKQTDWVYIKGYPTLLKKKNN